MKNQARSIFQSLQMRVPKLKSPMKKFLFIYLKQICCFFSSVFVVVVFVVVVFVSVANMSVVVILTVVVIIIIIIIRQEDYNPQLSESWGWHTQSENPHPPLRRRQTG